MNIRYIAITFLCFGLLAGCKGINANNDKALKDKEANTQNTKNTAFTDVDVMKYANTITVEELKEQLYYYASDEMEGRDTGSPGQKKAVNYLRDQYIKIGVPGGGENQDYFQTVPGTAFGKPELSSENVLAFIKGKELPDEVLVISAHLDHVGMENGEVFNGADDDGSGTIALLEIAEAFKQAVNDGYGPKRSILFLHVTGEEIGLKGSKYYAQNPIYPMANTIANLNIDMIGRIDPNQKEDPDYLYLIGSDMLSQDLHDISEAANKKYINMRLDYTYNGKDDPNRFYYRSDHYNFAKNNVPVIFYFNGVHEDYHKATDTPDKIEYELYTRRTKLIFATAWELANAKKRPALK
jgi:Zn-dependent M28 family amino/carboxypeptidase